MVTHLVDLHTDIAGVAELHERVVVDRPEPDEFNAWYCCGQRRHKCRNTEAQAHVDTTYGLFFEFGWFELGEKDAV